jgi:hypothetical protein
LGQGVLASRAGLQVITAWRATPLVFLFRRAEEERIARRPGRLLLVQSRYPAADGYGLN